LVGNLSTEALERMYADVGSLALKWNKPLSGTVTTGSMAKKDREKTEYNDPFLFNTRVRSKD
jgi:uncharacterized protein